MLKIANNKDLPHKILGKPRQEKLHIPHIPEKVGPKITDKYGAT